MSNIEIKKIITAIETSDGAGVKLKIERMLEKKVIINQQTV